MRYGTRVTIVEMVYTEDGITTWLVSRIRDGHEFYCTNDELELVM